MSKEAMKLALDALDEFCELGAIIRPLEVRDALRKALAEQESGIKQVIELYDSPDQPSQQEPFDKHGSPCPEFWDWLPKAYNFDGDGTFTKYNMEVAFLAGKQSVATSDTSQERVDEMQKQRHDTSPPAQRKPLTDEEIENIQFATTGDNHIDRARNFARAIEAKLKEKNNG